MKNTIKKRKKSDHKQGTIKEFKTVLNRIKKFDDSYDRKTYLKDINISWSDNFEEWINKEGNFKGTIEKSYTILITVLYHFWEVKDEKNIEMTDKFQSKKFKRGSSSKNKPKPISEKQLMALYNYRFTEKHFETVRKMILLQCFIGMCYDDIKRIKGFGQNMVEYFTRKLQLMLSQGYKILTQP